ncbi:MAG: hypothetical protein ABH971_02435 [bacterium]
MESSLEEKRKVFDKWDMENFFLNALSIIGINDPKKIEEKYQKYQGKNMALVFEKLRSPSSRKQIIENEKDYKKSASILYLILKEKFLEEKERMSDTNSFLEKYLENAVKMAEISGDSEKIREILKEKIGMLLQKEELDEARKLQKILKNYETEL